MFLIKKKFYAITACKKGVFWIENGKILVRSAVDFRNLSYVSVLVGGLEGIDNSNLALDDFYTPLPVAGSTRFLEGLNSSGTRK